MAAVELIGGCAHALGHGALQIGMHGAVLLADDVPARLRLPSGSPDFRLEQVGLGDALGRPNELLLLLRKVSAEILRALRTQPDTSVHDFNFGRRRRSSGTWTVASETFHRRPERARRYKPGRQRDRRFRHR